MSPFENLHTELVELVVSFLELRDIASLRLTCRNIEGKASQQSFSTFFKDKNVILTSGSLQEFARITDEGRFGCLLQHCTLTGIVSTNGDAIASDIIDEHSRLLAVAFRNLKQHSPGGGLASLALGVAAHVGSEGTLIQPDDVRVRSAWRFVWDTAARTFSIAMTALEESQVSVGVCLDVFGQVPSCSLAHDVFLARAGLLASTQVFGSLKKLTLSLSGPYRATYEPKWPASIPETSDMIRETERNYSHQALQTVAQLPLASQELAGLNVHWFDLGRHLSTSQSTGTTQVNNTIIMSNTMCIKSCKLRGVFLSETELQQFLQGTRVEDLTLTDIHLRPGTYGAILSWLTDPDSSIKSYHLDDLRENSKLVHFNIPGHSKFPYLADQMGPSTLTQHEGEARESVSYRLPSSRPLGSPQKMRWTRRKTQEFGPPESDGSSELNWRDKETTKYY